VGKAGHTGTLDPMATGLLVICLGRATRLVQYLTARDKTYTATVQLGIATDTLDAEGQVIRTDPPVVVDAITAADFDAALPDFRGEIEQVPPMYSAIKVDGRPLHERARAGEVIDVPARTVFIHQLTLDAADPPAFDFTVQASKGTYVRTLAADIAETLGVGGHLTALRRTAIGALPVGDALTLEAIEADPEAAVQRTISMAQAIDWMPIIALNPGGVRHVRQGKRLNAMPSGEGLHRALDPDGQLVAIMQADGAQMRVVRGFPPAAADGLDG
jgi:tRNA pseudouridine55 synthase